MASKVRLDKLVSNYMRSIYVLSTNFTSISTQVSQIEARLFDSFIYVPSLNWLDYSLWFLLIEWLIGNVKNYTQIFILSCYLFQLAISQQ